MSVPPDEGNAPPPRAPEPEPPLDFDPYRFGKPEHPVAPEWAPPGYRPPDPGMAPPQFNYPPAPPSAPYGAPRPGNTKATIALTLGILAIVLATFLSIFDLALAIPAIVLGVKARKDAQRFPAIGGAGKATAGLVCGIVAIALVIAFTVYVVSKISSCIDQNKSFSEMTTCAQDKINSGN